MFCREDKTLPPIPALLEPLVQQQVIVLNGGDEVLSMEQEMALYDFVVQGGGLICLGDAAQRYREREMLGKLLGPLHGFLTPQIELMVRKTSADHYLTRRVEDTFPLVESVYLLDAVPLDADIHWQTSCDHCTPVFSMNSGL